MEHVCEKCRYWKFWTDEDGEEYPDADRRCVNEHLYEHVWPEGYDGYHLDLITGPRFGCIHWEAKP
jgi:hypothetical protein